MDVKEFCRKFSDALEKDSWGDIDPHLFKTIGYYPEDDWGSDPDTSALYNALETALSKEEKT